MSNNHDLDYNEVMSFFDDKFSCEDQKKDWEECKDHVGKHSMEYEVFAIAYQRLNKDSSIKECIDMISDQMDEWDL